MANEAHAYGFCGVDCGQCAYQREARARARDNAERNDTYRAALAPIIRSVLGDEVITWRNATRPDVVAAVAAARPDVVRRHGYERADADAVRCARRALENLY